MQLSNEERVAIARQVAKRAAGRVPVVAGGGHQVEEECASAVVLHSPFSILHSPCSILPAATFEGGVEEQARLMNEIGKYVDGVVVITNQICGMEEVREEGREREGTFCV